MSRRFLALAGSAKDFPYPPEPEAAEPESILPLELKPPNYSRWVN